MSIVLIAAVCICVTSNWQKVGWYPNAQGGFFSGTLVLLPAYMLTPAVPAPRAPAPLYRTLQQRGRGGRRRCRRRRLATAAQPAGGLAAASHGSAGPGRRAGGGAALHAQGGGVQQGERAWGGGSMVAGPACCGHCARVAHHVSKNVGCRAPVKTPPAGWPCTVCLRRRLPPMPTACDH